MSRAIVGLKKTKRKREKDEEVERRQEKRVEYKCKKREEKSMVDYVKKVRSFKLEKMSKLMKAFEEFFYLKSGS